MQKRPLKKMSVQENNFLQPCSLVQATTIDETVVGSAVLHFRTGNYRCNGTLGFRIGEARWGRGLATAVVAQMVQAGFTTYGLSRIDAKCWPPIPVL